MSEKTRREDLTKIEKSPQPHLTLKSFYDYEVIQELPAGGAEADNFLIQKNQQKFFLKLYRKGINPNIDLLKNLKELSQKLKEHVVEIYDVGFDNQLQRYYEIMEFVPYGDLRELIKEIQSLPENKKHQQIDLIIKEMAHALKFLHDHDIIHRDLKPSNILIRNKDPLDLVFIDFGISKQLNEDLSKIATSSFKGTIYYIAPEEISNYFGKEIDWWHFGVIIYELLTGKNPFANLSEHTIINLLTTKNIEIPKNIPEKYQTLLKGLLTRDYEKRWQYLQVKDWLEGKINIPLYYEEEAKSKKRTTDSEKIWDKHGIPQNSPWRTLELEPEKVITFKQEDFGINEAKKWIEAGWTNGKAARNWFNNGFEPEEAYIFENIGLSIKQAKTLTNNGITAFDLNHIKDKVEDFEEFLSEILSLIKEGYDPSSIISHFEKWKQTGMSLREATEWASEGFQLKEVKDWIKNGFSLEKAKEWKQLDFNVKEALEWKNAGLSPQQAKKQKQQGFDVKETINLKEIGFSSNEAKEWKNLGFNIKEISEWKERGFTLNNALEWKNAGFNVHEATIFTLEKIPLEEAKEWKIAGFSIEDAIDWYKTAANPRIAKRWQSVRLRPKHFVATLISVAIFYIIEFIIFLYFFFTIVGKR